MCRHPVLGLQVSTSSIDFAFHSRLVVFKKREIVTVDQKGREVSFALRSSLHRGRGLGEPAKAKIVVDQSDVGKHQVGFQSKGLLGCLDSPLILARAPCAPSGQ